MGVGVGHIDLQKRRKIFAFFACKEFWKERCKVRRAIILAGHEECIF